MNNKNIVGNGSKATLPNGQKLSDKIQENKTKHNIENNSSRSGDPTSTSSGSTEEKEKQSKGSKTQAVGKEATKQALKTAAGTVPYTSWIPKGIRDKIIDKVMDSGLGEAAVEKAMNDIKRKIMLAVVGIVVGIVGSIIGIATIYAVIVSPLGWIKDVAEATADFFSSAFHFAIGQGWCTDEESCSNSKKAFYYDTLNATANNYKDDCNVEFNQELITATIFYDRMVRKEPIESSGVATQFDSAADNLNSSTYYLYTQDDIDAINELDKVYRNRASAATCPLATQDKVEDIIQDIKDALEGDYDSSSFDQFLLKYRSQIEDTMITVDGIVDLFVNEYGEKVDRSLWQSLVVQVKGNFSCLRYSFDRLKFLFKPGSQCVFNKDNYSDYLKNYYIPLHYNYLTEEPYNMTKDEIVEEIFKLANINLINNAFSSSIYCSSISVKQADGNIEPMDLETYVARVVTKENNWYEGSNIENMKAQAIAARTYALNYTDNCKSPIPNSTSAQALADTPSEMAIRAAEETNSLVLLQDGKIFSSQYDALAIDYELTETKNDENYYLKQASLAIPKDWLDSRITQSQYEYYRYHTHGNGMSQWGSRYLQTTGKDYEGILETFYTMAEITKMGGLITGGNYSSTIGPAVDLNELAERRDSYSGTLNIYSDKASNVSQCPWYAKSRAIEIIYGSDMSEELKNAAIQSLQATYGNGTSWFDNPDGTIFTKTTDYTQPKPGSIVSWSSGGGSGCHTYGHVAIVEQVYQKDGKTMVLLSDSYNGGGADSGNSWSKTVYRTYEQDLNYIKQHGSGCVYRFNGYVYLLG